MITEEEKEEIINLAVERTLLSLPKVVGNLMTSQVTLAKINNAFYDKHPEFRDKKDVVAAVVGMVEGENTLLDYDKILEKAVPKIKDRLKLLDDLDMENVQENPDRTFNHGEL
jgi:hypothetical protein